MDGATRSDGRSALTDRLLAQLAVPVVGAPMFTVSGPALVIAQCTSGIVGTFPALNARPAGAITPGRGVLAARALGADLAYIGTRFIASAESAAPAAYKQMILEIWSAGQGVGSIDEVLPVGEIVARLAREYEEARRALA